ncbi:MAG: hypothetical protein EOR68_23930 [Mesorhizobium sp.]|uniref:hypothetical protein n=1 Tax=Mesorhizobium sp. TaxID=1871066 RepID=UPI000FE8FA3A|nr:hypothetical protein [Mesorhizobium sp.]RWL93581.1 MAG: hypothetical protein EOR68_23930 [Mesorhizobium sp.]TIP03302.1 MAG: hypothetical protein E5X72_16705 [Mesorhizobium sp.]
MLKVIAAGMGLGLAGFLVAVSTMGGGHGTNVPGFIVVPWMMLLLLAGAGTLALLSAACAQFVVYMLLIRIRLLLALPIALLHCAAMVWGMAQNGILF